MLHTSSSPQSLCCLALVQANKAIKLLCPCSGIVCCCWQEQAFAHKYPCRDPAEWQDKAVKYKPENRTDHDAYNILMGDLVSMLPALFHSNYKEGLADAV